MIPLSKNYRQTRFGLIILFIFLLRINAAAQTPMEIIENSGTRNFNEIVRLVEEYYADKDKGKGSGYKQFKRWEHFNRTRLDEHGNVVNVSLLGFEQVKSQRQRKAQGRIISSSPGNWKALGPDVTELPNYNGRINCVTVDPANATVIYAGSASGGVWRSIDDGKTWSCLTDGLSGLVGVTSIVIDPQSAVSSRTLYVLTGDKDGGSAKSIGILKSTDNGNSWSVIREGGDFTAIKLMMHPTNRNILYYVTRNEIFKSTDAGLTWVQKYHGQFTDMEFNPGNPSIIYLAGYSAMIRSTDAGETFQPIATGPEGMRTEIAVTPANPALVYVFKGDTSPTSGLYKSTDHGVTFTKVATSLRLGGQYWYDMALAVSPTDANRIFAAAVPAYSSSDGGVTWTSESNFGHVDYHSFNFYHGKLYVGNDGGIFRKNISTGAFENLSEGLAITQIYAMGQNAFDAEEVIIGSQDNGTGRVKSNFSDYIYGGDGMECFFDKTSNWIFYFSWQNGNLLRGTNAGDGSHLFITNINPPGTDNTGEWQTPFVPDPSNVHTIYAGFNEIWKSTDTGDTWVNITNGKTEYSRMRKITIAPSNSNYIYAIGGYLFRTNDGGATWTKATSPQIAGYLTSVTVHPEDPLTLWVTGGGFIGTEGNRVAKSTDGGNTWTQISGSLPLVSVNTAVYQKGSANGIYIGNDLGVYYKDDTMNDWVSFDAGMPYAIVTDLEINESAKKIYAATYGRGVWYSDLIQSNASPTATITSPAHGQNFVSPANIVMNATASDPNGTIVRVEFYNGNTKLGEDVTAPYSFTWSNVTAGVYTLGVKAFDNDGGASLLSQARVAVTNGQGCAGIGAITREEWTGVTGKYVSQIPVNTPPTSMSELEIFEAPFNKGDNYGARIRGYVCVPVTGNYTFWIASDDHSELWLSTDETPANKTKIAYLTGASGRRVWTTFATQQSSPISLTGGKRYYIEALHKEGTSNDHLAVGWQLPDGTLERPIAGTRLLPFNSGTTTNTPPVVSITNPQEDASFTAPTSITISASASDSDGSVTKVEFYNGTSKLGEDTSSPYNFTWSNVGVGNYVLTARATDNMGSSSNSVVNVSVTTGGTCTASGTIQREVWTGVTGKTVSLIPVDSPPSSVSDLNIFEAPYNVANDYGARIRGYVCVPQSGNYVFWIESDDNSELWLSTTEDPASKTKIAYVTGATARREWTKFATQQSTPIALSAGKKYYIEALHKEGTVYDHLAVGWQLPDGTLERPIPGNRLIRFSATANSLPVVTITKPANGQTFSAPASVAINATASDSDGTITKVEFYNGSTKLGEDSTSPYSFTWSNVAAGNYVIRAKAIDNLSASGSASVNIAVESRCVASGTIVREVWTGITGKQVSLIPVGSPPTSTSELTIFEAPYNVGDNYGARIRGYICVPETGNYVFWIASDDQSELWLSTDDQPVSKVRIASTAYATSRRQWDKYATQQSSPINLVAGRSYYIEALHKEGTTYDHLAVGWQLPGGVQERPIPGSRLSPFMDVASAFPGQNEIIYAVDDEVTDVTLFPNPYNEGVLTMRMPAGVELAGGFAKIQIVSAAGKITFSESIPCDVACATLEIPLSEKLPAGMYVVNAVLNRRRYFGKLVVH